MQMNSDKQMNNGCHPTNHKMLGPRLLIDHALRSSVILRQVLTIILQLYLHTFQIPRKFDDGWRRISCQFIRGKDSGHSF